MSRNNELPSMPRGESSRQIPTPRDAGFKSLAERGVTAPQSARTPESPAWLQQPEQQSQQAIVAERVSSTAIPEGGSSTSTESTPTMSTSTELELYRPEGKATTAARPEASSGEYRVNSEGEVTADSQDSHLQAKDFFDAFPVGSGVEAREQNEPARTRLQKFGRKLLEVTRKLPEVLSKVNAKANNKLEQSVLNARVYGEILKNELKNQYGRKRSSGESATHEDETQIESLFAESDVATETPSAEGEAEATSESEAATPKGAAKKYDFLDSDEYKTARDRYLEDNQSLAQSVAATTKTRSSFLSRKDAREEARKETDASLEAYNKAAAFFDQIQLKKWEEAKGGPLTDEELAKKMATYHEVKQRLQLIHQNHALAAPGEHKGFLGKLRSGDEKLQQWYAGLSKRNKVLVAAGGLVVGAGIGLGAGALGGAFIGAGAAIGAGAKMYQSYAKAQASRYDKFDTIDPLSAAEVSQADGSEATTNRAEVKTSQQVTEEGKTAMANLVDRRVERADKTRRRTRVAVGIAAASLATGGVIKALEVPGVTDWIGDHFGGTAPVEPEIPPEVTPEAPEPPVEVVPAPEFSVDAFTVEPGEGGFQTLQEMGVPEDKLNEVWADAANELNQTGNGSVYLMDNGEWGWTSAGTLSDSDMAILKAAAERHGVTL